MVKVSDIYNKGELSTVSTTGSYSDLLGLPTLGTAAATASTDYATAAQGALADTALQPATIASSYEVDIPSLEYRQVWTVNALPPTENYDGFNAYMLTDLTFKSYRDTVRALDGELNAALFDAYGLVSSNGVAAFSLVWGQWVAVSGIVDDDRLAIASVAEGFNLPGEFVGVIRG